MKKQLLRCIALLCGLLSVLAIGGCARSKPKAQTRLLVIFSDVSKSTVQSHRAKHFATAMAVTKKQHGHARVLLYQFAQRIEEKGKADVSRATKAEGAFQDYILHPKLQQGRGTFFGPVLKTVKDLATVEYPDRRVTVLILSDGGIDDLAETTRAAKELQKVQNVDHVIVAPVYEGDARTQVENCMKDPTRPDWLLVASEAGYDYGAMLEVVDKTYKAQDKEEKED